MSRNFGKLDEVTNELAGFVKNYLTVFLSVRIICEDQKQADRAAERATKLFNSPAFIIKAEDCGPVGQIGFFTGMCEELYREPRGRYFEFTKKYFAIKAIITKTGELSRN